jgi:hypothetical protein
VRSPGAFREPAERAIAAPLLGRADRASGVDKRATPMSTRAPRAAPVARATGLPERGRARRGITTSVTLSMCRPLDPLRVDLPDGRIAVVMPVRV